LDGIVVGVDLGTTRSPLAVLDQEMKRAVPGSYGSHPAASVILSIPSVVCLDPSGEPRVGEAAQRRSIEDPRRTLSAVLRLLGRRFDSPEIQRRRRLLPYEFSTSEEGGIRIDVEGKLYRPLKSCGSFMRELKSQAETRLERPLG
jgi:molecular chaperone DnaK